jgi:hypothetical protein
MTYNRNKKMRIQEDKVVPELKADVTGCSSSLLPVSGVEELCDGQAHP